MAKKSVKPGARRTAAKSPAKKKTAFKQATVRPTRAGFPAPRRLKPAPVKRFRFHKPIKHPVKLSSVWQLTQTAAQVLWDNRIIFITIVLIYAALNLVFLQGLTNSANATSIKTTLEHILKGNFGALLSGLGVFTVLVGSAANSSSPAAGPYQLILALMTSLAVIWVLRQAAIGVKMRIRDAYYRSMYPLVPFILVLLVICIQLLPVIIGAKLYTTVMSGGIAAHSGERIFWLIVFILLAIWSLYLLSSSIFALYVVTLPDMTPLQALRSAKDLVRHRRWTVFRKIICLPIILLIVAAIIMVPIILIASGISQWIFFLLSMAGLVAVHAYMYTLYRELLNE